MTIGPPICVLPPRFFSLDSERPANGILSDLQSTTYGYVDVNSTRYELTRWTIRAVWRRADTLNAGLKVGAHMFAAQ